jgi:purine-binding chemotaxis protein CheW
MPGALSKKSKSPKTARSSKPGGTLAEPSSVKAGQPSPRGAESLIETAPRAPAQLKRTAVGLGSLAETAEHEVQVVTFTLGKEEYAIDILQVQEIVMMREITRMPRAPEFIEGIVNLRGQMIPIIDMRKRFSLDEAQHDSETRIIIVEIAGELVGMVVDGVREVIRLPDSAVSPPPPMIQGISSEYLRGIGQIGERLLIMLDLEKVLSANEQEVLRKLGPDGCPVSNKKGGR